MIKTNISFLLLLLVVLFPSKPFSQSDKSHPGADLFQKTCKVCHNIGEGRLVGPDLIDVHKKRSDEWLQKFIKSSQTMINSGDKEAVAIFQEYNQMIMPDAPITEQEIKTLISYIKFTSGGSEESATEDVVAAANKPPASNFTASPEDIELGQNLFQGTARLSNGGPSCISCHDVKNDAIIGGGILAKELTRVFSRMGEGGVRSVLGSPPFPVMNQAYKDKSLKDDEIFALLAFLQKADKEHALQQPRDYGVKLAMTGIVGVLILLLFYSLVFNNRRKKLVNQEVFDRQIKSQDDNA